MSKEVVLATYVLAKAAYNKYKDSKKSHKTKRTKTRKAA